VAEVPRGWIVAGHYFRVLAISSVLTTVFSIAQTDHFRFDLSFLLLLWIASGVMEGRKGHRAAARGLLAAIVVLFLAGWSHSLFLNDFRESSWSPRTSVPLAALQAARFLLM